MFLNSNLRLPSVCPARLTHSRGKKMGRLVAVPLQCDYNANELCFRPNSNPVCEFQRKPNTFTSRMK